MFLHFSLLNACDKDLLGPFKPIWHVANVMHGDLYAFKTILCMAQLVAWWPFTEERVNSWKVNKFFSTFKQNNNSTPGYFPYNSSEANASDPATATHMHSDAIPTVPPSSQVILHLELLLLQIQQGNNPTILWLWRKSFLYIGMTLYWISDSYVEVESVRIIHSTGIALLIIFRLILETLCHLIDFVSQVYF